MAGSEPQKHEGKKKIFRVKRFRRSEAKLLTRSKFPGFFKTAYTETSCDTCLTSSGCMDTCSSAELNAAPKLKGRANTNYLSAQYEQPPLDWLNKL